MSGLSNWVDGGIIFCFGEAPFSQISLMCSGYNPTGINFLEPILRYVHRLHPLSIPDPWAGIHWTWFHKDSVPRWHGVFCSEIWGILKWSCLHGKQYSYSNRTESVPALPEVSIVTFTVRWKKVERREKLPGAMRQGQSKNPVEAEPKKKKTEAEVRSGQGQERKLEKSIALWWVTLWAVTHCEEWTAGGNREEKRFLNSSLLLQRRWAAQFLSPAYEAVGNIPSIFHAHQEWACQSVHPVRSLLPSAVQGVLLMVPLA